MAQNFNLGTLGQVLTVNTAANTTTYVSALVVGNSSVNVVVNSSSVYVNGSPLGGATNTAAQYTWSNTQTFQNTITFSSTINGTANNSLYLGGIAAASYVNTSQLSSNLSGYQTTAGLSANVATLTSNNSTYAFGKTEGVLNVNSALTSNNSSYLGGTAASGYQTTAGLSANVATLTANNTSFVGSVTAANVVSNAQLSANLANYAPLGGATFTGAVVVSNNLTVTGNLTLSGNTLIVGANNLVVADALISLHTLANLAPLTSNDGKNIGIALHYYDTSDKHALIYRDNSTGRLQYHTDGDDPQTNTNPQGSNLGIIQAASFWAGNSSVYATVNATTYTGTANNANNLGGVAAASYVNTAGAYTRTGVTTFNANVVIGTTAGISANGSYGTANQVLTSNGTTVYWANVAAGSSGGTISQQQFTGDGTTATFTFNGGYTSNTLAVYLNGVLLRNGTEANVVSGSTFTITPTPVSGDLIDAIAFSNINLSSSGNSAIVSQQFTANGTANSFTVTGGYIPSNIQVYLNGVKQIPGTDVVITSGNTVNFAVTPANTYIVDVYGYQNAVTLTSNTLSVSGTITANAYAANGTVGSNGQVLTSNGSTSYWANAGGGVTTGTIVPATSNKVPTTATSGDGTTATVTFYGNFTVPVGGLVTIANVTPTAYNGTWTVTASSNGATTSTVSFASSANGSMTVAGTIYQTPAGGYLLLDGSIYSRASYPALSALAGSPVRIAAPTLAYTHTRQPIAGFGGSQYIYNITGSNGTIVAATFAGTNASAGGLEVTTALANGMTYTTDGTTFSGATAWNPGADGAYNGSTYVIPLLYIPCASPITNAVVMTASSLSGPWTRTGLVQTGSNPPASFGSIVYGGTSNFFVTGVSYNSGGSGANTTCMYTSSNGTTWANSTVSIAGTSFQMVDISAYSGGIVAIINTSGGIKTIYSASGASGSWTDITSNFATPNVVSNIKINYINGKFVLQMFTTTSTTNVYTSTTGAGGTWTQVSVTSSSVWGGAAGPGSVSRKTYWNGTVYGNYNTYSTDLINWAPDDYSYWSVNISEPAVSALSNKILAFDNNTSGNGYKIYTWDTNSYNTSTQFPIPNYGSGLSVGGTLFGGLQKSYYFIKT